MKDLVQLIDQQLVAVAGEIAQLEAALKDAKDYRKKLEKTRKEYAPAEENPGEATESVNPSLPVEEATKTEKTSK